MNINSVIDHCLGLSLYQLQDFAGENYKTVHNYIKSVSNANPNHILVGTIFTCIASDGKLSEEEWNFIAQFIGGYSYDEAFKVAGDFYSEEAQTVARDLVRNFPADIQDAYLCICIAVLAVDKRLRDAEIDFLKKILGY